MEKEKEGKKGGGREKVRKEGRERRKEGTKGGKERRKPSKWSQITY
jgi:hypothetical protein